MKLPRDLDGPHLARALRVLGYETTRVSMGHEVIPCHRPIKIGTLSSILKRVAAHHHISVDDLLRMLDI